VHVQKLAEAALRALPGGAATLSALRRSVLSAAGVSDAKDTREAAAAALSRHVLPECLALLCCGADAAPLCARRRLAASRRFAIEGDSVRLVAGDDADDDE